MKEVVKGLVKRGEKFLVLKRAPLDVYFPEHWDFPGGHVGPGEEPTTCLEREIMEETELTAKAADVAAVYEIDIDEVGSPTHRFTIYNTESYFGEVRISHEHMGYRWMTSDEVLNQDKLEPCVIKYFEDHPE